MQKRQKRNGRENCKEQGASWGRDGSEERDSFKATFQDGLSMEYNGIQRWPSSLPRVVQ